MDTQKTHFHHTGSQPQYMYQSVNMTIPICHCLKAISLHSDLLRDQLYHLNVPEECKFLWITAIGTHKHLNQNRQMPVFKQLPHVKIHLVNTIPIFKQLPHVKIHLVNTILVILL